VNYFCTRENPGPGGAPPRRDLVVGQQYATPFERALRTPDITGVEPGERLVEHGLRGALGRAHRLGILVEHLVDRHRPPPIHHHHPLHPSDVELGRIDQAGEGLLADEQVGAVPLCGALHPGGQVDGVADHGEGHPIHPTDEADPNPSGVDPDSHAQLL
jgi:hypothetical protein